MQCATPDVIGHSASDSARVDPVGPLGPLGLSRRLSVLTLKQATSLSEISPLTLRPPRNSAFTTSRCVRVVTPKDTHTSKSIIVIKHLP